MIDPMGTLPLFELPDPEPVRPATLAEKQSAALPRWRTYTGTRVACDECVHYLHQHHGQGPLPRAARRVRIVGRQQWRLCPQHAEPREKADKEAAERRKRSA